MFKTLLIPNRTLTKLVNRFEVHEESVKHVTNFRKHPGRRSLPKNNLPYELELAALKVIAKYKRGSFREDVIRMYNRFHHQQLPAEPTEVLEKYKELKYRFGQKDNFVLDEPGTDAKEIKKREDLIQKTLKKEIYNWQPTNYDEYQSVVYMAARLAPNYAGIYHVFNEIKHDYPDFKPRTLFDFGSGIGTTTWAANAIWPGSFKEHFCVDISQKAHDIARLLLKQGDDSSPLTYEGVFTRQFLPVSSNIKYDMVVSAYSLLELPSFASRVNTIENLWHKTEDLLVIIEHGKKPGYMAVLEARNLILQMTGHKVTDTFSVADTEAQIIQPDENEIPTSNTMAPCPHNYPCPKLFSGQIEPCNFSISFEHLNASDFRKILWGNVERFSYCVIQKKPKESGDNPRWPRVIRPIVRKQSRAICKVCCPDGTLKTISVNKRKESKKLFNLVRLSKWSDQLPITIHTEEKEITGNLESENNQEDDDDEGDEIDSDNDYDEINLSQQSTNHSTESKNPTI